ncbi:TorF family putative porin [Sulfurovum sp.]|uniref:TorF family putative porin n=1 Tax=Sulfurovum sp. TaxID=1969726 RepID=UPI002867F933|nr:TorF family putative porin [Sulfurovum sp.]
MKLTKLSLVAALAASTAFAGGDIAPVEPMVEAPAPVVVESAVEISANLAITSNYVWRGMTQTANSPAVQGGLDLGYNGFYLGTWGSNVEFGDTSNNLEADFYAGYAGEVGGFGYDIGYIYYAYPNESDAFNFDEAYVGLSYDFDVAAVNGKYSFGLDSENDTTDYWEVGASAGLPMDFTLAASYGDYDEVGTNYLVSLAKTFGKFEVTLAYTDFEAEVGDYEEDHIVASISTSF